MNILADAELRQGLKEYSNWPTFPQLYVDGKLVGGCDIVTSLNESGELEAAARRPADSAADRLARGHDAAARSPARNDDGYRARGHQRPARGARSNAATSSSARPTPSRARRATRSACTARCACSEHGDGVFSVDGTPADCVYVALYAGTRVLPRRPDVVVSGMNHGVNLGDDVFYSGTVAAAREGALKGIPRSRSRRRSTQTSSARAELGARLALELAQREATARCS